MCPSNTLRHFVTLLISCALFRNVCVGLVNSQEDSPRLLRGIHKTPESMGVLTGTLTFQIAVLRVLGPRRDFLTQHRGDKCLTQQTYPWNSERLTSGSVRLQGDVEIVGHQADSGRGMLRGKGEEEEVAR